jgi:hypothetical protein
MGFVDWLRGRLWRLVAIVWFGIAAAVYLAGTIAVFYGTYWVADWLWGPWWPLGWIFVIAPLQFVALMLMIFFGKEALRRH